MAQEYNLYHLIRGTTGENMQIRLLQGNHNLFQVHSADLQGKNKGSKPQPDSRKLYGQWYEDRQIEIHRLWYGRSPQSVVQGDQG